MKFLWGVFNSMNAKKSINAVPVIALLTDKESEENFKEMGIVFVPEPNQQPD